MYITCTCVHEPSRAFPKEQWSSILPLYIVMLLPFDVAQVKVAGYRAGVVNLLTSQVYCVSAHRVDAMKLVALCRGLVGLLFTTKSGGLPSTSKATRGFKLHETSSQKSNCANVIARRKSAHVPFVGIPE